MYVSTSSMSLLLTPSTSIRFPTPFSILNNVHTYIHTQTRTRIKNSLPGVQVSPPLQQKPKHWALSSNAMQPLCLKRPPPQVNFDFLIVCLGLMLETGVFFTHAGLLYFLLLSFFWKTKLCATFWMHFIVAGIEHLCSLRCTKRARESAWQHCVQSFEHALKMWPLNNPCLTRSLMIHETGKGIHAMTSAHYHYHDYYQTITMIITTTITMTITMTSAHNHYHDRYHNHYHDHYHDHYHANDHYIPFLCSLFLCSPFLATFLS